DAFPLAAVASPAGVDDQVGGMAFLPDGRLAVAFHRGEVFLRSPAGDWQQFAEGLHEPLGLLPDGDGALLVMQRPELTRLEDVDGDGRADRYRTVWDGFGMTGNYHEFAFGPARGPDGALYVALNLASSGDGIFPEIRGAWSPIGRASREQMVSGKGFASKLAGRMYSRVPYRGCVMRLPDGGRGPAELFATGFRSPDGLGFDAQGRLLVNDNQGDWRGSSPLHVVTRGSFNGHPASLVWRPGWDRGDPLDLPVAELEAMRSQPAGIFVHGELSNSPTQPAVFPAAWGTLAGQVVFGEMNAARLVRFVGEDVGGVHQGAMIPFLDSKALRNGNHRLAFAPDGALWVGKTHLSWAGHNGLVRIEAPKSLPPLIETVRLKATGFEVRFTRPVDKATLVPALRRFRYKYHVTYGSPKVDEEKLSAAWSLSADGQALTLPLPEIREGFVHEINLKGARSVDGRELLGPVAYYQVVKTK
ncbi:MAG: DUF7133 domain-containing protein, partial [Opitutales bacterium]